MAGLVDEHGCAMKTGFIGDDDAFLQRLQDLLGLRPRRSTQVQHDVVRLNVQEERGKHAHRLQTTDHPRETHVDKVLVEGGKLGHSAELVSTYVNLNVTMRAKEYLPGVVVRKPRERVDSLDLFALKLDRALVVELCAQGPFHDFTVRIRHINSKRCREICFL